jgi:hypothetical protein
MELEMNSNFFKTLIIAVVVCMISACVTPPVQEPQVDQDNEAGETGATVDQAPVKTPPPPPKIVKLARESWANPDHSADGIGKVLVMVIFDDETKRSQYEIELSAALKAEGVKAAPRAWDMSLQGTPGRGRVEWVLKNKEFDHLLVTRLSTLSENERRQAGTTEFEISGAGGQFAQFWETIAQQSGTSGKQSQLFVENSLFETAEGITVWRSRSKTTASHFTGSSSELIAALTKRLRADGLIASE